MKFAAVLLIGIAAATTAEAQSGAARYDFLPMPKTMPPLLFAPDPLAGKLLRPLTMPAVDATAFVEVTPQPATLPAATVQTLPDAAAEELAVTPSLALPPEEAPAEAALEVPQDAMEAAVVSPDEEAVQPAAELQPDAATEVAVAPATEAPPVEEAPMGTKVTVIVENVQADTGTVNVAVCDKDLSREGCPYVREVKAHAGFVEAKFDDIPPGTYAVVGYHDVNGNNSFDKLFGMPREPYALSSKAGEMLVPTFADAALPIKTGDNAIIIRLKRLGG